MRLLITIILLTILLTEFPGQVLIAKDTTKDNVTIDKVDTIKKDNGINKPIEIRAEGYVCCKGEKQKDVFDILAGLLTPIIAVIALWIAWKQWTVQKYKAKSDLFERRMKIYENIHEVLVNVLRDGSLENVNVSDFHMHVRHSRFLFDKKTKDYISEIGKQVVELNKNIMLLDGGHLLVGEERTRVAESKSKTIKWLIEQIEIFDDKLSAFMEINKI